MYDKKDIISQAGGGTKKNKIFTTPFEDAAQPLQS